MLKNYTWQDHVGAVLIGSIVISVLYSDYVLVTLVVTLASKS